MQNFGGFRQTSKIKKKSVLQYNAIAPRAIQIFDKN